MPMSPEVEIMGTMVLFQANPQYEHVASLIIEPSPRASRHNLRSL